MAGGFDTTLWVPYGDLNTVDYRDGTGNAQALYSDPTTGNWINPRSSTSRST